MVPARLARGIGSLLEHGDVAVRPFDPRRAEAGLVGSQRLHAVDEAVAEILVELVPRPVDDVAVLVGHLGVAFGGDPPRGAIVGHAIGLKGPALVEELDRADGRDDVLVLVVDQLIGVDDELVLRLGGGCGGGRGRCGRGGVGDGGVIGAAQANARANAPAPRRARRAQVSRRSFRSREELRAEPINRPLGAAKHTRQTDTQRFQEPSRPQPRQ